MGKVLETLKMLFSFLGKKEDNNKPEADDVGVDIKEVRRMRREFRPLIRRGLITREEANDTIRIMIANIRSKKQHAISSRAK